jgi:hypothetical protein
LSRRNRAFAILYRVVAIMLLRTPGYFPWLIYI